MILGKITSIKSIYIYLSVFFVIILTVYFLTKNGENEINIEGFWQGQSQTQQMICVFNTDQSCSITLIDLNTNTKIEINGDYELDLTKKPIPMSIKNISELNHSLYAIIKPKGENQFAITAFSSKWRLMPITFNQENTITLTRKT